MTSRGKTKRILYRTVSIIDAWRSIEMAAKGKGAATSKRGTLEQQSMQHTPSTAPGWAWWLPRFLRELG
jgi:hypothetical protein